MMNCKAMVLVFCIFLGGLPQGIAQNQSDVTPKSIEASSTLDIVGPEETIDIGEEVLLRIEGLTLKEVEQAQDEELFDLTAFPLKGLKIKASYDWMFRTLDLEFRAKHPGDYLVKIHLVREGKLEIATIQVTVEGDDINPPPGPDPPGPKPNPFPSPSNEWIEALQPIVLSPLEQTSGEKLCDFFQTLKSQAVAGAIQSLDDLHKALSVGVPGIESGAQPEYKAAMVEFFNVQFGQNDRFADSDEVAYLFDALSWATWEAANHE